MAMPPRRFALALVFGVLLGAGGLSLSLAAPPKAGHAPDPPGHAARKQWVFEISVDKGKLTLERATPKTLEKPLETARQMGRFALEFHIGKELLDRVRFNVPLMEDTPPADRPKRIGGSVKFDVVTTRVRAQMADHPRATMVILLDRATNETKRYAWPPEADGKLVPWTMGLEVSDGGVGEGGVKVISINDKTAKDGGKSGTRKKVDEKRAKDAGGD